MKRVMLVVLICVGMILPISSFSAEQEVYLKGLELAVGQDVDDIRYGTKFAGKVYDSENQEKVIGFWNVSLNYRGAEWVEVCEGRNDVIYMRLLVVLDDDDQSGVAVFRMRDKDENPDVFWDYRQPLCGLGGFGCDDPWGVPENMCPAENDETYGPVARIGGGELDDEPGLQLYPVWRTGCFRRPNRVQQGYIKGWLRHNYPLVPRIDGTLTLVY